MSLSARPHPITTYGKTTNTYMLVAFCTDSWCRPWGGRCTFNTFWSSDGPLFRHPRHGGLGRYDSLRMWVSPARMRVSAVFEPSQAFLSRSLDFVADRLDELHLRKEAHVPTPVGGAPSINSGTHGFSDAASALLSEQTLCSNPTMSNIHVVIYLLFFIFRRLPSGTLLSPTRPPYDLFPYGLVSSTDTCLGPPKDASAAPSRIQICGNGELCSHLFPRPHG